MRNIPCALAILLLATSAAAEPNLTSEDGFLFDIDASTDGGLFNGNIDAYDDYGIGCYGLTVNGTVFNAGGPHTDYYSGRGFRTLEMTIGDLRAQRFGFVPAAGPSYIRYIDTVRNAGAVAASVTFSYYCNLGSDGAAGEMHSSEDGDAVFETNDAWIETDDTDLAGDPSLGHVMFQPGAETVPDLATYGAGEISWSYTVSIAPGETGAIMIFGIQQADRASAHTDVLSAVDLTGTALDEVGIELDGVRNFVLGGAPLIQSGGPYEVDEGGGCVSMHASVSDREGDPVTFAWDLDNDGVYETEDYDAEYCATAADGPSELSVGVIAADDQGNSVERQVPILVVNVAPTITSVPPTVAVAGSHFEYQVVIDDPAGAADPPAYRVTNLDAIDYPEGLLLDASGLFTWDPREDQANQDYSVRLEIEDGDDGLAEQDFTIHVRPNTIPTTPEPAYPTLSDDEVGVVRPTLITRNATDPDDDAITYNFRVADNVGFVNAVDSGPVSEGDQGATEWAVTYDLTPGLSYYWQVTATDGIGTSEAGNSAFTVSDNAEGGGGDGDADTDADSDTDADADGDGRGRGPGCACRTSGGGGPMPGLLVLMLVGLALRRRRF